MGKPACRRILAGFLAAGVAFSLTACGGGGGTQDAGATGGTTGSLTALNVSGKEFAFDPATLVAAANTEVTVHFSNNGTMEHNFTIDEANLALAAQPGESVNGAFTLAPGTYAYYCSVSGHEAAGMKGTLTVR